MKPIFVLLDTRLDNDVVVILSKYKPRKGTDLVRYYIKYALFGSYSKTWIDTQKTYET